MHSVKQEPLDAKGWMQTQITGKRPAPDYPGTEKAAASYESLRSDSCKKVRRIASLSQKTSVDCVDLKVSKEMFIRIQTGVEVFGSIFKGPIRSVRPDNLIRFRNKKGESVLCRVETVRKIFMLDQIPKLFEGKNYAIQVGDFADSKKLFLENQKTFGAIAVQFKIESPCEHELLLQEGYYHDIKNGDKKVEGRLFNEERFGKVKPGDLLSFRITPDTPDKKPLKCRIKRIARYESFMAYLMEEKLIHCLPRTKTLKEGVEIYRSFPGYRDGEQKYGVICFEIELLK
ncbi:MAG: hypothetical protein SNF33_04580 [Candidatus Algichlamydia australiensis]|nr:hypothetical protein [Chlamydiales bacterium]